MRLGTSRRDQRATSSRTPSSWTWQAGNRTGRYRIERDGLGRITSMGASVTGYSGAQ